LAMIINESFAHGIFPESLKVAKVTPIFKSGPKEHCTNYRPISLLSNISKIFEKCMFNRLSQYLEKHKVLYDLQFGFRKHHSTSHALIHTTDYIKTRLDKGELVGALFLDFQKAFDSVNQQILLQKLSTYGVRGNCLEWFRTYLLNRRQFVVIDDAESEEAHVSHGVPQGSTLGPLLFLLYINDFHACTHSSLSYHFADDTTVFFPSNSVKKIRKAMSLQLHSILDWLAANRVSLNAKKTELVLFRPKNKPGTTRLTIKIRGCKVFTTTKVKYLGVILDHQLRWKHHITELEKKLSMAVGLLCKLRHYVDTKTLRGLYFNLFHSHLLYGSVVWGHASQDELKKLYRLQKRAVKIITFADLHDSASPLFHRLGILKLKDAIQLRQCELIYDWTNNHLPSAFSNYFTYKKSRKNTRLAVLPHLTIPERKTDKYGGSCMKYWGALLHNQLLRQGINLTMPKRAFTNTVKAMLLASYV
jgi:hypothetical protein